MPVDFVDAHERRLMTTLRQDVEIINKLGLHARASAKFTQLAGTFACEIWLERNGRRVNGKSIMGVMMLAAGKGTTVTLETDGDDAEAAMAALVGLINDYFGEGE
jgi:phosphocarrier protein HPr